MGSPRLAAPPVCALACALALTACDSAGEPETKGVPLDSPAPAATAGAAPAETSDNARSEDPNQIITDIIQGLTHPERALTEVDRVAAIKQVVAQAKSGDVILLAGKGHETYQEAAGVRHDYDERALARQLSEQR